MPGGPPGAEWGRSPGTAWRDRGRRARRGETPRFAPARRPRHPGQRSRCARWRGRLARGGRSAASRGTVARTVRAAAASSAPGAAAWQRRGLPQVAGRTRQGRTGRASWNSPAEREVRVRIATAGIVAAGADVELGSVRDDLSEASGRSGSRAAGVDDDLVAPSDADLSPAVVLGPAEPPGAGGAGDLVVGGSEPTLVDAVGRQAVPGAAPRGDARRQDDRARTARTATCSGRYVTASSIADAARAAAELPSPGLARWRVARRVHRAAPCDDERSGQHARRSVPAGGGEPVSTWPAAARGGACRRRDRDRAGGSRHLRLARPGARHLRAAARRRRAVRRGARRCRRDRPAPAGSRRVATGPGGGPLPAALTGVARRPRQGAGHRRAARHSPRHAARRRSTRVARRLVADRRRRSHGVRARACDGGAGA